MFTAARTRTALSVAVARAVAVSAFSCPRAVAPRALAGRTRPLCAAPAMTESLPPAGMTAVLFLESGIGTDQHGQDLTKAAVRACKDAISFNSIPSIQRLVPGGRDAMKLRVQLAVPYDDDGATAPAIDLSQCEAVFPYGTVLPIELQRGGARFASGCAVPALGDTDDSWVMAIACVTVGY